MFNLDRLADRTDAAVIRVRLADVIAAAMWLAATGLLTAATVTDSNHLGRWGIFVGMMALAVTIWCVATWMLEVMRLEFEISKLRQLPATRRTESG